MKETETISDPALKKASDTRRTQARQSFGAVTDGLDQVRLAYDPFIASLRDLRTALGSDLTEGGVNAAAPTISKAKNDGQRLKQAIVAAQGSIATFRQQTVSPK